MLLCSDTSKSHVIFFDIKMDITRKYRYVSSGHLMDPPSFMTYEIVVGWYIVCIVFIVDTLNDLDILSVYIQNDYINSPMREKFYFYADDKQKPDRGRIILIVPDLCGIKSSALMRKNNIIDILFLLIQIFS